MGEKALPSRLELGLWLDRLSQSRPFLRWAGGKQSFLQRYSQAIPSFTGKYVEPFLGSGAVFFYAVRMHSRPFQARLGDTNKHLIKTYIAVRDDPEEVYEQLKVLQAGYEAARDKARFYYQVRDSHNARHPRTDPAVFIFLNKTCWNGLYRVNKEGKFNVPYGAPRTTWVIPSFEELLNASSALKQAHLRATSWENTLAFAEPGDFVFLDPPYFSDIIRDDVKYRHRGFTARDHRKLAYSVYQLAQRGIDFLLTNSGEPEMVELYARYGLQVDEVQLPRAINSKTDERGNVPELIVRSWRTEDLTSRTDSDVD